MHDYDSRYEEAAWAEHDADMTAKWGPNWAGLIDTESDDPFFTEFGALSNNPDAALLLFSSMLHSMGLTDSSHCYTCYVAESEQEHDDHAVVS